MTTTSVATTGTTDRRLAGRQVQGARHRPDQGQDGHAAAAKEAAEKAKIELELAETSINLPYITADADKNPLFLDEQLTRAEFQKITQDLLDRTRRRSSR